MNCSRRVDGRRVMVVWNSDSVVEVEDLKYLVSHVVVLVITPLREVSAWCKDGFL